jgi:hypothetical protein
MAKAHSQLLQGSEAGKGPWGLTTPELLLTLPCNTAQQGLERRRYQKISVPGN